MSNEKSIEDIAREDHEDAIEFLTKFVDFVNKYHEVEPVNKANIRRFLASIE